MTKKEQLFLGLAILFFVFGFTCVSLVSGSIAQYIGKHGWKHFNRFFVPLLVVMSLGVVTFVGSRFWIRWPSWKEWSVAVVGAGFSFWVVSRTLLLTTELIHIPQFAICTVLFSAAFPRNRGIAIGLSSVVCVSDEWFQSFLPNRILDLNDVFLNFIGLFVGLAIWWAMDVTSQNRLKSERVDQR